MKISLLFIYEYIIVTPLRLASGPCRPRTVDNSSSLPPPSPPSPLSLLPSSLLLLASGPLPFLSAPLLSPHFLLIPLPPPSSSHPPPYERCPIATLMHIPPSQTTFLKASPLSRLSTVLRNSHSHSILNLHLVGSGNRTSERGRNRCSDNSNSNSSNNSSSSNSNNSTPAVN
jgi:hypothetical protein